MDYTAIFPQFTRLPAELRLGIWETAARAPSIHLFDVCLPRDAVCGPEAQHGASSRSRVSFGDDSLAEADQKWFARFEATVFLDLYGRAAEGGRSRDPSMYKWKMALGMACVDAAAATAAVPSLAPSPSSAGPSRRTRETMPGLVYTDNVNSVFLPGPRRIVHYNNRADVLHLCFPALRPAATACHHRSPETRPVRLLDVQWSSEMAETLRAARCIALDAAHVPFLVDVDGPAASEELVLLACTLQMNLDVLYLVVDGTSRCCDSAGRPRVANAHALQRRGRLVSDLASHCGVDGADRPPDVIQGVGRTYREVFDLEKLGWGDSQPTYLFALGLGEAIRMQQQDRGGSVRFQGIRVLVMSDNE